MVKPKCSIYFPYIFSKFSSNFLQLFQMTKLNCFHHHRSTDVCKNTVKDRGKTFCSNEFLLCQKCVIFWLHGFCVNQLLYLLWQCPWSHIWHLVCVCVRVSGWISQPYIVLCPVSKHKLAEMPQQARFLWMTPLNSCKNNGWDGETELSSHAPARPQTARLKHVRHIETPRSAKHEANNRFYKIWPLRQKIAVAIWPSAAERYILRYFKRNLRHLPTWLYIEESTLKHRVPAQPLHPACSNCHPAKSRVLTTQRARKTY